MRSFAVPKQKSGSLWFPKIVSGVALLLFGTFPACAQWQRIEMDAKGRLAKSVQSVPHPLQFYLTPTPDRDPSNSLCIGCKTANGQAITLGDFSIESSKQIIGDAFGKTIYQIDLSFNVKKGSVVERMRHEWEEQYERQGQNISFQNLPPVEWKSIVMQSSTDMYRELYLIIDEGTYTHPLSEARLLTVGGVHMLTTNDPVDGNGGQCTEGYWELDAEGPWLLDFTAIHEEIDKIIPPDATAPQIGCWALSIEKAEVKSPIQLNGAECHACGYIGTAVVHFKIEGHRVVPVSSSFEQ